MTETAVHTKHKPYGPYEKYFKRPLDVACALAALIVLSPLLLILTVTGAIAMKGNPFFVQERPGRIDQKTGKEQIFPLIKFRTMSNARGIDGSLLPDKDRLNRYGKILRSTSCDELPELINILLGQLAVVGPRPLLVKYLPYYSDEQRHRHDVRPGLTGYSQIHGRNAVDWDERLQMDVEYTRHITFRGDVKIVVVTALKVLKREGISQDGQATMAGFTEYCEAKSVRTP